jgi:hypothetical protein
VTAEHDILFDGNAKSGKDLKLDAKCNINIGLRIATLGSLSYKPISMGGIPITELFPIK